MLRGQGWGMLPFGMSRISSHHMTGRFEYLLRPRKPMSISSIGVSSQRSCFCCLRREGLASTRYMVSMLEARGLKFRIVCYIQSAASGDIS